ncbi:bestrophin-2-like isoform X2 [Centruroides sculpturatus]|uniref:bestrophin-2-like isoform X2 n=1 Tax=Centruroides sculpturatus TaxID=218467 RepID=UPI000C6D79C2|nr:bestrophin-2-like isoform X2 [Centruroides sculpturatus]
MTVTYTAEVATSRGFGCFWKLLFRWRGSIYKLLWPELTLYLALYYSCSAIYRFVLTNPHKRYFEKVAIYCNTYADFIPVSFVLGFYVSLVVKRWWDSFMSIPWPDSLAFFVSAFLHGQDERGRLMRRTIMRYVNLALIFTMTSISPCVKKRFPTLDHLVEAGILLANEKKIIEQMKTHHSTYWMPLVWASSIAARARKEGRIRDDFALNTVVDAIANYRALCGGLLNYDWISIPLVYTQVVTLVVYTFFLASLMGQQYLDPAQGYQGHQVDLYVPVFNFLQFFFYMGWLKVAETLVNPFGEDDDDFEVNWVIDRDIQVSYLIVDEMHQEHPELIKDQYWDEIMTELPYTAAAMPFHTGPPQGSAAAVTVPEKLAEFVPMEPLEETPDEPYVEVTDTCTMPMNTTQSHLLSQRLSGSMQSSISGLAGPYHPHSQQKKNILSMLHKLFTKESIGSNASLQSCQDKSRRLTKSISRDSNISQGTNLSNPPSPTYFRESTRDFNDDIFHLSDLSLAESRSASVAHSPGVTGNLHMSDMFARLRADRPHKYNVQRHPSYNKQTLSVTEEEKTQNDNKLQKISSLKQLLRPKSKEDKSSSTILNPKDHTSNMTSTPNGNGQLLAASVRAAMAQNKEDEDDDKKLKENKLGTGDFCDQLKNTDCDGSVRRVSLYSICSTKQSSRNSSENFDMRRSSTTSVPVTEDRNTENPNER